jgi:hypothetical protein
MRRREFIASNLAGAAVWPVAGSAQQTQRIPRIASQVQLQRLAGDYFEARPRVSARDTVPDRCAEL